MEKESIALLVAATAAAASTVASFWIRRKRTPPAVSPEQTKDLGLVTAPAPALKPLAAAKAGGTEGKVLTGHLGEVKDQAVSETSIPLSPQWLYAKTGDYKAALSAAPVNCMNSSKQEDVASASASGIVSDQFASIPELDSLTVEPELEPEPHEPHLKSIETPNVTRQKPFQLLTEKRGRIKEESFRKKVNNALVEEEKRRRFKARPMPSFDHYFTPKKLSRPPTVPKDPNFCRRRSVGSLRSHNDNVGSQLQKNNHSERLCRVLFDNVKESEEDTYNLIKENMELNRSSLTELKEPGEESKNMRSDVQMQEFMGSSSPKLEENKVIENTYFAGEMPFERDIGSRKRKSVDSLRVSAVDIGSEMQHGISPVFKNLFDSMEGENEGTFDSVKENGVPGALECKYTDTLMPMPLIFVENEAEEASPYRNKENLTPNYCSGRKPKKSILGLQRSPSNELALLNGGDVLVNRVKDENEELFAHSYKKNLTPCTSSGRKMKKTFLMSQRSASNDLSVLNEKKQMFSPGIFTTNKENLTPKVYGATRTAKSLFKRHDRVLREVISKRVEPVPAPLQRLLENSPSGNRDTFHEALYSPADQAICSHNCMNINKQEDVASGSNRDNLTPTDSASQKSKRRSSNSLYGIQREEKMKKGAERVPFQSFMDNSSPRNCKAHNSSNQHISRVLNKAGEEKKTWNIVVDASCLLDDQSRKSLELLEGLEGTYLIIPRIVTRELDCMKRREGLFYMFSRTRKASSALSWIESCMVRSSWWIHVQSSFEMMPINGSNAAPSSSKPCSSCGSLLKILSPTAEDHILDCALLFRKLRSDAQFVLLTHSVTLKIKALAEGLICEAPNEFCESLVNPYSKRFLWVNSRPRGRTWSTSDDNYYHHFQVAVEGAKGLELILPRVFHC